jgi:hypothetical protein
VQAILAEKRLSQMGVPGMPAPDGRPGTNQRKAQRAPMIGTPPRRKTARPRVGRTCGRALFR